MSPTLYSYCKPAMRGAMCQGTVLPFGDKNAVMQVAHVVEQKFEVLIN